MIYRLTLFGTVFFRQKRFVICFYCVDSNMMGLKLPKKILGSILAFLKPIAKTTVMFTIYGIYF